MLLGISHYALARVRGAESGVARREVTYVVVFCLLIFVNGFENATVHASPYQGESQAAKQIDGAERKVVFLLLAELSGVTSLYRYHYGVEPSTNIDLRDEQRMQEGIRGVLTLLVITVVAPVGLAIFFLRRKNSRREQLTTA